MTREEKETVSRIEKLMEELAYTQMERPTSDPFVVGVQAGKYHGLKAALLLIEEIHAVKEQDEAQQG